ncbi:hypothetical protein ES702_00848 [subsurface metagenome]
MDINTSIYLLTGLLIHLTLVIKFVITDPEFTIIIIKFHIMPITLCLITAIFYLFDKEISSLLNIINISRYLMLITLIITGFSLFKIWNNIFGFLSNPSKSNEKESGFSLPIPYLISLSLSMSVFIICSFSLCTNIFKAKTFFDPYLSLFWFFGSMGIGLMSLKGIFGWSNK